MLKKEGEVFSSSKLGKRKVYNREYYARNMV
jgi:hypothetical protein